MLEKIINGVQPFLPLKISDAVWEDGPFKLQGPGWNFITECAWRASTEDRVLFACYDTHSTDLIFSGSGIDASKEIKKVIGLEIICIDYQDSLLKIDPVFVLSNGQRLEIFSTRRVNSWTFEIEQLGVFRGIPSEPDAL